ncbi:MAG TPA: sigma-70 family RNA polymerase sigma factor [Sphingomicrobium sp.]|nr:sigma-70 family RNA polymerase sigma factor [Sphingomicrobium sp.]
MGAAAAQDVDVKAYRASGECGEADGALMQRVAQGDSRALATIADRHTPMLYAIAWRMLGDAAEAEDVVQEAILKLWVGAKGWTPVGAGLGGWLRRIATNLCIDRQRKGARMSDGAVPDLADNAPSADALIDEQRRADGVAAAMQQLPDRQRAAIVLTYYEGVSNAEAAQILGLGIKALESLLVRARQGLSRSLAAQGLLQEGSAA